MKKILGLMVSAMLVMGLVGAGTFAFFSDPETSTGNILSAGTLDLKTNNIDGVSASLFLEGLAPGIYVPSSSTNTTITLKNDGTIDAASLTIAFSYAESDNTTLEGLISGDSDLNGDVSADAFSSNMTIDVLGWNGIDLLGAPYLLDTDGNINGRFDLQDLANASGLTGLAGLNANSSGNFTIRVHLETLVGNDYMADGIIGTFTFTINQ